MLTVSPLASPVTSLSSALTVWRLLKSEMLPIFTASPTSSTMQTSAKSGELERRGREVAPEPHDDAPEQLVEDPAERGRLGGVGLADDAVDLVGRRRARAVGRRGRRRRAPAAATAGADVGDVALQRVEGRQLRRAVEGGAGAGERLLHRLRGTTSRPSAAR